jgi:hypothetical protein
LTEFDKEQARAFLREFKRLAREQGIFIVPREANNQALIDLNINARIRKQTLLALSVTDYSSGPDPDRDAPGFLWTFGVTIGECDVYIKLKIAGEVGRQFSKCVAFHRAREPMFFPFR